MALLSRQVEGKIYYSKFDDLAGWTEERDLRDYNNDTWTWELSSTELSTVAYSSPTSLDVILRDRYGGNAHLIPGRYIRRVRTITIPAGLTSVRMQVRHRWCKDAGSLDFYGSRKITLGSTTFLEQQATDAQDTWFFKNAPIATSAGVQTLRVGAEIYQNTYGQYVYDHRRHNCFDDLVIARGGSLLVKGLPSGWKAKLYDASDALIAQATESSGIATIDASSQAYPVTGRIRITNGSDVVQFTGDLSTDIFGGDEYLYASSASSLSPSTDNYVINKTGATSPTSATVTFTLKDTGGSPLVGKTLAFSTSLGSLNPANASTNSSGQASTVLTSTLSGVAVAKGEWAGDASNPRVYNTIEISVHEDADASDTSRRYDVWIQGRRQWGVLDVDIQSKSEEDTAKVVLSAISLQVQGFQDLAVYRYGQPIFSGRIEVIQRSLSPEPTMVIQGRSMLQVLMRIPISNAAYANQTLKALIQSLFSTYVDPLKQVTLGTISDSLETVTISINLLDTTVYDVLSMIAKLSGTNIVVTPSRSVNVL